VVNLSFYNLLSIPGVIITVTKHSSNFTLNILSMRWLVIIFLLIGTQALCQCKTFMIGIHGDTLNCTDNGNLKQGKWVVHIPSLHGEPGYEEEGVFKDGKKEGTWRRYTLQGDISAIENYKWGYKNGLCDYYDMWGLEHEESWKATNPANPYDTIEVPDLHDDTKIYIRVIKVDASTSEHGTWTFYDSQRGTIIKTESYVLGQKVDPITGKPITTKPGLVAVPDSTSTKKATANSVPPEVLEYEKKNANKKKIKVRDGETGN